jgi:hypothetical protein
VRAGAQARRHGGVQPAVARYTGTGAKTYHSTCMARSSTFLPSLH